MPAGYLAAARRPTHFPRWRASMDRRRARASGWRFAQGPVWGRAPGQTEESDGSATLPASLEQLRGCCNSCGRTLVHNWRCTHVARCEVSWCAQQRMSTALTLNMPRTTPKLEWAYTMLLNQSSKIIIVSLLLPDLYLVWPRLNRSWQTSPNLARIGAKVGPNSTPTWQALAETG